MSKGKNNNKANKAGKIPVKVQPLKPQAVIVKKNVKEIKPNQITNKNLGNKMVKTDTKKPIEKKVNQPKKVEKAKVIADIEESCDDEDESDIDFAEMDDSDIDDVDIEESEDGDDVDIEDSDDEVDEDDDDEVLDSDELENSDYESIEIDDQKINADADSSSEENDEPVKKTEKPKEKVQNKVKKETNKPEIKKVESVTPKVVEAKKNEIKEIKSKKVIDETTNDGKLLIEINERKNSISDITVFVSNITAKNSRQSLLDLINPIAPVVAINMPAKTKNKVIVPRGYAFIRMVNSDDAKKCVELLVKNKMKASKFVCKSVFTDIKKISRNKIVVNSFTSEDITAVLSKEFKAPIKVIKNYINQYTIVFPSEEAALALFNKKSIVIAGHKIFVNYYYGKPREGEGVSEPAKHVESKEKVTTPKVEAKEKPKTEEIKNKKPEAKVAVVKTETKKTEAKVEVVKKEVTKADKPPVKAGVKRQLEESSDEEDDSEDLPEVPVKKFKQVNGAESKVTPKKENAVTKSPAKTPENKKFDNKTKTNIPVTKKPFNKSPGEKRPFNKSPGNNKPFNKNNKSPNTGNKSFNKSPGNKKPFNKKF